MPIVSHNSGSNSRIEAPPHRAVLDTQVVLDWLVFRESKVAALAHSLEIGGLRWLACQAMLDELERVLNNVVLAKWTPNRAAISQTVARLVLRLDAGIPIGAPLRCSDIDDQMFIDLALAAGAQWLFTRDRALLRLADRARNRGVIVLRPADWQPSMAAAASNRQPWPD